MEALIPVINQLQDVCNTASIPLPIDLPQIVVIGLQSSGKSSVIESLVKREFLPRGEGLVTRRPIIIRLIKITETKDYRGDYVKFGHLPSSEFFNFNEVRQEIEEETRRVCGNNGINDKPITINIYSKDVVNLTLVDLPGLVYFPTEDQPQDIQDQIRALIQSYIENPNCIILTVIAATQDFVTSEAIKIAHDYDKERKRTLAVLTKLDSIDPGKDALNTLTGKLFKMRLGIIGVVNRSHDDKRTIEEAIEDEKEFLEKHYPLIADRNGQPYLSHRLSQLLMVHIRACLPELKEKILSLLSKYQDRLLSYGEEVIDRENAIINSIGHFSTSFCRTVEGGGDQIRWTELRGGARIAYILHDSFGEALSRIDPLEVLNNNAILTLARNIGGCKRVVSEAHTFNYILTMQISRLEEPSLRCADLVHNELVKFVKSSCDQIIRFPVLRERIQEILIKLLEDQLPVTKEAIKSSMKWYSAYIDTEHPALSGDGGDVGIGHDPDLLKCSIIAHKVKDYFNLIKQVVKLSVPGAIMHHMVDYVMSNVQTSLIKNLYQKELFDELLTESHEVAQKRIETSAMLVTLKKARDVLDTIQNFNS